MGIDFSLTTRPWFSLPPFPSSPRSSPSFFFLRKAQASKRVQSNKTRYAKTRQKLSYQGWKRQLDRRKRMRLASKRIRDIPVPTVESATKYQLFCICNSHKIHRGPGADPCRPRACPFSLCEPNESCLVGCNLKGQLETGALFC